MALMATLLLTVKVSGIAFGVLIPVHKVYSSDITVDNVVSLANVSRAENELQPLTLNSVLSNAAQAKADDMMLKQYFSHDTPEGFAPWKFIRDAGYSYIAAGENLAIDFHDAESMEIAWMNSPGHRANILNKNFQEIGIGIASGFFEGKKSTIVVQMFGTPIAEQVALAVKPTVLQSIVDSPTGTQPQQDGLQKNANVTPNITDTNHMILNDYLRVTVATNSTPVKVIAKYGDKATLLDPASDSVWIASIPLSSLGSSNNLTVTAYDINGLSTSEQILQVTPSLNVSDVKQETNRVNITLMGKVFDPKVMEQNIFWGVLLFVLVSLLIGISVQRKVQHVNMVAQASFVAMLATILTMT